MRQLQSPQLVAGAIVRRPQVHHCQSAARLDTQKGCRQGGFEQGTGQDTMGHLSGPLSVKLFQLLCSCLQLCTSRSAESAGAVGHSSGAPHLAARSLAPVTSLSRRRCRVAMLWSWPMGRLPPGDKPARGGPKGALRSFPSWAGPWGGAESWQVESGAQGPRQDSSAASLLSRVTAAQVIPCPDSLPPSRRYSWYTSEPPDANMRFFGRDTEGVTRHPLVPRHR